VLSSICSSDRIRRSRSCGSKTNGGRGRARRRASRDACVSRRAAPLLPMPGAQRAAVAGCCEGHGTPDPAHTDASGKHGQAVSHATKRRHGLDGLRRSAPFACLRHSRPASSSRSAWEELHPPTMRVVGSLVFADRGSGPAEAPGAARRPGNSDGVSVGWATGRCCGCLGFDTTSTTRASDGRGTGRRRDH
jgi:hypothetical protein